MGRAVAIPLAPLGAVKRVGGEKLTGRSDEEVKAILERDLAQNQYFVTGSLTREIFADDCRWDTEGLGVALGTACSVAPSPVFASLAA